MDNSIALCKGKYETEEDFWTNVTDLIDILIKQDYEVLIRHEDFDIYVLEFAYDPYKTDFGSDRFMRVTADEEDVIIDARNESKGEVSV